MAEDKNLANNPNPANSRAQGWAWDRLWRSSLLLGTVFALSLAALAQSPEGCLKGRFFKKKNVEFFRIEIKYK